MLKGLARGVEKGNGALRALVVLLVPLGLDLSNNRPKWVESHFTARNAPSAPS